MEYRLEDIIDIPLLQDLQEKLNVIYSFPSAIIDNDGKILTAVAWQDVCTKFHRTNPICEKECIKSDQYILEHLHEAKPAVSYQCPHGLVDNATPIIIDGKHYGNFFTGQFFLEKPDLEFFKKQAAKYGFDEKAYLEAVCKAPVWSKEKLFQYLDFIKGFIEIIAGIGLKQIKERETNRLLIEKEDQHQTILQTAMDGFWIVDVEGNLLEVNEKYCMMSGYSQQELLGMNVRNIEVVESAKETEAHIQTVLEKGEDRFETLHRRKNGSLFNVEISVKNQPELRKMFAFIRDTTKQKQADEDLNESNQFNLQLIDCVQEGIVVYDHNLKCKLWNPYMETLTGMPASQVLDKPAMDIFPFLKDAGINNKIKRTLDGEIDDSLEIQLANPKNGEIIWATGSTSPLKNSKGEIIGSISTVHNITERKKAEENLRKSEDLFKQFMNHSPGLIYLKDENLNLLKISNSLTDLLGQPESELIGKDSYEFVPPEFAKRAIADDLRVLNEEATIVHEEFIKGRYFSTTKFPILDKTGKSKYIGGFSVDITTQKLAEENLIASFTLLQNIIDLLPIRVFWKDKNLNYLGCNKSFAKDAGKNYSSDIVGTCDFDLSWKEQAQIYRADDTSVIETGISKIDIIEPGTNAKGNPLWLKTSKVPLTDLAGNIIGVLGAFEDITNSKLAEEELRKSESLMKGILDNSSTVVYLKDVEGKYLLINPLYEKLFHVTKEYIIGKTDYDIFPKDVADKLRENDIQAIEKGEAIELIETVPHDDGVHYYMSAKFTLNDINGKPYAVCGISSDYTDRKLAEEALKENEIRFREVLENSTDAAYKRNLETNNYDYLSPVFAHITGYLPDEFESLPLNEVLKLIHPDDLSELNNVIAEALTRPLGSGFAVTYRFKHKKHGRYIWLYDQFNVMRNVQGKPIALIGSVSDISLRKNAEEVLIRSEEKFRTFFENTNDGIIVLNPNKQLVLVNNAFAEMHGYTVDEMMGMNLKDLDTHETFQDSSQRMQKILSGERVKFEADHYHKLGNIVTQEVTVNLVKIDDDDYILAFHHDVTERNKAQKEILQSKKDWEDSFDSITDMITIHDLDYNIILANKAGKELLKLPKFENYLNVKCYTFFHGTDSPPETCVSCKSLKTGLPSTFEYYEPHLGRYLEVTALPRYNSEKEFVGLIHVGRDISERKKAEEKLNAWNIQFRKLSNNAPGLIYQFTRKPDGTYFVPIASEGIKDIFGCSPEDVIDDFTPIANVLYPEDAARVISDIEYSAEHLTHFTCEFRVQIPGKHIQWIYSNSSPEKLPDGGTTWFGFNTDITAHKLIQEALIKSETSLKQAQEIAMMGDWELDLSNLKLIWSENCFSIYGLSPYEIEPTLDYLKSRVHPDDLHIVEESLLEIMENKTPIVNEMRIVFPDGTFKWIQNKMIPIFKDDKLISLKGINIDIANVKLAEVELRKAKEKAEESDRLKSAFLANMSHEIRTPMGGVLGFAKLLKKPGLIAEKQQSYIKMIEKSGTRMLNIINDIIDISKIESGQMTVDLSNTNINQQIEFIYNFFKPEVEAKGMQLSYKVSLASEKAIIKTDQEKIYAILTNLVKNAIKYSNHGSIEFGYDVSENMETKSLLFFVKDTGIGVPADRQEAVFERFIQADILDKMARQGAGLGLSISKAYVELLGGKIWLESEEEVGSTFCFSLPYNPEIEN